ncbi:hypothetical protein AB6F55_20240 [Providencia hangzhouensis]
MVYAFELGTREPWAGYFRYRMIYAGNETNKFLSPIAFAGQLIGVATLVGAPFIPLNKKTSKGCWGGLAVPLGYFHWNMRWLILLLA